MLHTRIAVNILSQLGGNFLDVSGQLVLQLFLAQQPSKVPGQEGTIHGHFQPVEIVLSKYALDVSPILLTALLVL